jgi:heme/copper-type cytochrome/quinol oxidase subunit 2
VAVGLVLAEWVGKSIGLRVALAGAMVAIARRKRPNPLHPADNQTQPKELVLTIVGILIVIILILLVVYLFRRV